VCVFARVLQSPFCIDGDPHPHSKMHVRVLHKAIPLFCLPETTYEAISHAPNQVS
jgi:hypothetical protein